MARIVLVTGGCRSGKSAYAQRLAESLPPTRLYVATCPVTDDEMQRRIEQHRRARQRPRLGDRSKNSSIWPASSAATGSTTCCWSIALRSGSTT